MPLVDSLLFYFPVEMSLNRHISTYFGTHDIIGEFEIYIFKISK